MFFNTRVTGEMEDGIIGSSGSITFERDKPYASHYRSRSTGNIYERSGSIPSNRMDKINDLISDGYCRSNTSALVSETWEDLNLNYSCVFLSFQDMQTQNAYHIYKLKLMRSRIVSILLMYSWLMWGFRTSSMFSHGTNSMFIILMIVFIVGWTLPILMLICSLKDNAYSDDSNLSTESAPSSSEKKVDLKTMQVLQSTAVIFGSIFTGMLLLSRSLNDCDMKDLQHWAFGKSIFLFGDCNPEGSLGFIPQDQALFVILAPILSLAVLKCSVASALSSLFIGLLFLFVSIIASKSYFSLWVIMVHISCILIMYEMERSQLLGFVHSVTFYNMSKAAACSDDFVNNYSSLTRGRCNYDEDYMYDDKHSMKVDKGVESVNDVSVHVDELHQIGISNSTILTDNSGSSTMVGSLGSAAFFSDLASFTSEYLNDNKESITEEHINSASGLAAAITSNMHVCASGHNVAETNDSNICSKCSSSDDSDAGIQPIVGSNDNAVSRTDTVDTDHNAYVRMLAVSSMSQFRSLSDTAESCFGSNQCKKGMFTKIRHSHMQSSSDNRYSTHQQHQQHHHRFQLHNAPYIADDIEESIIMYQILACVFDVWLQSKTPYSCLHQHPFILREVLKGEEFIRLLNNRMIQVDMEREIICYIYTNLTAYINKIKSN